MPHFDEQAEKSIIIALCVTDHASQIFRDLTAEDFYSTVFASQFEWLHKAYGEGTFRDAVNKAIDKGLPSADSPVPVFDAVKSIRNHSIRRTMEIASTEISGMINDYSNGVGSIQDRFKELAVNVMDSRVCKVPSSTKEDIVKYRAEIQNDTRAFVTGFKNVDMMAPIQPGDFVVLAARPAVGKSALAVSFLLNNFLGEERHQGILISIEMDLKQIYARMI